MKPSSKTLFYRLPVISLCILIFWQSSYPGLISTPPFPHTDKLIHLIVYALLAFLTARCLTKEELPLSTKTVKITAIIFTILYGLSDELHQSFVPERTASAYDLLADAIGAVTGTFVHEISKKFIFFQN